MKAIADARTQIAPYMLAFVLLNGLIGAALAWFMPAAPDWLLIAVAALLVAAPALAFLNSRDNALTRYSHAISLALFPRAFPRRTGRPPLSGRYAHGVLRLSGDQRRLDR